MKVNPLYRLYEIVAVWLAGFNRDPVESIELTERQKFLHWMLQQPPERTVDHTKGWSGCAVGDYCHEILGDMSEIGAGIFAYDCELISDLGRIQHLATYGQTVVHLAKRGAFANLPPLPKEPKAAPFLLLAGTVLFMAAVAAVVANAVS